VSETALVPSDIAPGMVTRGFAEKRLALFRESDDPVALWRASTALAAAAQLWNGHGEQKREIKAAQMFAEVVLGGLLGLRPGQGTRTDMDLSHAISDLDGLIPQPRVSELQRYHRWVGKLIEEIRNGAVSRRSLLLLVDEWEAAERPDPTPDDLDVRVGDFREVLADVEPGSVALVLTDPPYPAEYLPLWDALGAWAAGALVDGGSLVAYCGHAHLPEVCVRLSRSLRYWWTLALVHRQTQMIVGKWVSAGWKPLVWYVRDRRAGTAMLADTLKGSPPRKTVPTGDDGSWAQGVAELAPIISALTAPGDLIVDPFAGSGTVGLAALRYGRRFIGAEVRG